MNAFKTDVNGLPMMDGSGNDTSNLTNMTNDMNIPSASPFVPYQGTVDPRLDWSVGRRGVPYLDWGVDPGASWVEDQSFGGPYINIKNMFTQAEEGAGFGGIISAYYYVGNSAVNVQYHPVCRCAVMGCRSGSRGWEYRSGKDICQYDTGDRAMNGCYGAY